MIIHEHEIIPKYASLTPPPPEFLMARGIWPGMFQEFVTIGQTSKQIELPNLYTPEKVTWKPKIDGLEFGSMFFLFQVRIFRFRVSFRHPDLLTLILG